MKRIALSVLVATAMISAPAMASDIISNKRMFSYYSASERDQVNEIAVKLTKWDVKNMQRALRVNGYRTGPIDGVIGPKTRSALKAFQADRNLSGKGKVTARTLGALRVAVTHDFNHALHRNYN